jgi:hypothetical protein
MKSWSVIVASKSPLEFQTQSPHFLDRRWLPSGLVILVEETRSHPFNEIGVVENEPGGVEIRLKHLLEGTALVVAEELKGEDHARG